MVKPSILAVIPFGMQTVLLFLLLLTRLTSPRCNRRLPMVWTRHKRSIQRLQAHKLALRAPVRRVEAEHTPTLFLI
ncbi:MAG TPA: hypothetical protein DCQ57_18080 [Enterobacteriaceae bacterium]|nr:hypothetical protein [Enterobacteriaceae bacterium]